MYNCSNTIKTLKMKNLLTVVIFTIPFLFFSQTSTVNYTPSNSNFANPERGFYHHLETHSNSYTPLSQSTLINYRTNEKITLVLRIFYLENFVNSPLSVSFLNAMQNDFNIIRNAGIKCIVRFAYTDNYTGGAPYGDASKATILQQISQLKPYLMANSDVISVVEAGFIGIWGEWYYTDHFGLPPTPTDYANRKEVVDSLLSALPKNRMIQIRTPLLKQEMFSTSTPLSSVQAFDESNISRAGHHNDCFLASSTDYGTYNNPTLEYPYLEQETKYLAMGGETCAVNQPRSDCGTAVTEMKQFHWSHLNIDYHPNVIGNFNSQNCLNDIKKELGYRFELTSGTYSDTVVVGDSLHIDITLENQGYASPYNPRNVYLVMRNDLTTNEDTINLNLDPRFWLPNNTHSVTTNIPLPGSVVPGDYSIFLYLPDLEPTLSDRPEYSIRLANTSVWESSTGYNDLLHTFAVKNGPTVGIKSTENNGDFTIFPNPATDKIMVKNNSTEDYSTTLTNSAGKTMNISLNKQNGITTFNTSKLSRGVYFIKIYSDKKSFTERVVLK